MVVGVWLILRVCETTVLCTAGNSLDLYELIKAEQKRDTAAGAAGPRTLGELFGEAAAAAARPAKRQRTATPLAAAEGEGGEAAAATAAAEGEEGDEEMEDREGQEEAVAGEKEKGAAAKGGESAKKGEGVGAWRWLQAVVVPLLWCLGTSALLRRCCASPCAPFA